MNKNLFQDWDYENLQKYLTHLGNIGLIYDFEHFNIFSKNFLLNINKDNYFDENIYTELEVGEFYLKNVFTQPYWNPVGGEDFLPGHITKLDKNNQQDFICHNNNFSNYVPEFCNLTHLNKLGMYDIVLSKFSGKKIHILQAIKKLGIHNMKDLVKDLNNPPIVIKVDCLLEEVIKIEEELTNAGATVLIKEHSIEVKDKTLCFAYFHTLQFNRFKNIAQEYKKIKTGPEKVLIPGSILECEALNGNYYVYEILASQDGEDHISHGDRVGLYISQNKNLDQMP